MRYFFEISYKGTNYHGWQRQNNAPSVQQEVEEALTKILQRDIVITGSGRTDTGVHCKQQFFHLDSDKRLDQHFIYALNKMLSKDISLNDMKEVTAEGHARFSALSRKYEYHINFNKDPFVADLSYYLNRSLDVKTMNEATTLLLGRQDFESFSKVKTEVNNFICDITEASWVINENKLIFHIRANRFLRGMVRAIVGTLLEVGFGKLHVEDIKSIILARDRKHAGATAPAHGLFLTEVTYPSEIFLK